MDGLTIHAALEEIESLLLGDTVNTLHEPLAGLFVLRFSVSRERMLIAPRRARIHVTHRKLANPSSPSPLVMKLRKHLVGTSLTAIEQIGLDRIAVLTFRRRHDAAGATFRLISELMGNHGNLVLLSDDKILSALRPAPRLSVGQRYAPPQSQSKKPLSELTQTDLEEILGAQAPHRAMAARVDGVGFETARALIAAAKASPPTEIVATLHARVRDLSSACGEPRPSFCPQTHTALLLPLTADCVAMPSLSEALDQELDATLDLEHRSAHQIHTQRTCDWRFAKLARVRDRLLRVITASPTADELRYQADLLLAFAQDLPRGASEFVFEDPSTGETFHIPLRSDLDVIGNAQRMYHKARRLQRGKAAARTKLDAVEREIQAIRSQPMTPPTDAVAPAATAQDARSRSDSAPRKRRTIVDGYTIDVGRSARENDDLLRRASPEDLWLHARGVPGSHVFIRHRDNEQIPQHVLLHAARLAALHSRNKNERKAKVSYTQVKHVRKPRNAPAGLVILARESTLVVTLSHGEKDPSR